jgi:hypothetical protein
VLRNKGRHPRGRADLRAARRNQPFLPTFVFHSRDGLRAIRLIVSDPPGNKEKNGTARRRSLRAPERAHQQRGESPRRTEHWLSEAEGNCVVERRGGGQPEANNQSIIKTMMNSIRPDALASMRRTSEARDGSRPMRDAATSWPELRRDSERRDRDASGGWR